MIPAYNGPAESWLRAFPRIRSLGREHDCRHTGLDLPATHSLVQTLRRRDTNASRLRRRRRKLLVIKLRHGAQAVQHVRSDVHEAGTTAYDWSDMGRLLTSMQEHVKRHERSRTLAIIPLMQWQLTALQTHVSAHTNARHAKSTFLEGEISVRATYFTSNSSAATSYFATAKVMRRMRSIE